MDVSVIIVNYNTADLIADCIKSIRKHTVGVDYEIVIVDNHSTENARDIILGQCGSEGIGYIQLQENVGFGRANNEGFKVARGRNVFCLNPDTVLLNNAIKTLSDYLDANPNVGACGGNLYDAQMQPTHSYMMFTPSVEWELHMLTFHKLEPLVYGRSRKFCYGNKPKQVAYITGADLMMRRSTVERTGGFSPDFFMYFEETDLCRRIAAMGLRIMCVPEARIQHLEGMSYERGKEYTVNELSLRHWEQGRMTFYRRNASATTTRVANGIYRTALAVNKMCFRIVGKPIWKSYACRQRIVGELSKAQRAVKNDKKQQQ